jgi:hypothetical protein
MRTSVLREEGYDIAALGLSLAFNSTVERSFEIMPNLAHKDGGHNKFLESIVIWLDIDAPLTFWGQFDTYRVGVTKQSESTMHTLMKQYLTQADFDKPVQPQYLEYLNEQIKAGVSVEDMKDDLPGSFRQRRIVTTNYKTLRNIYYQRKFHKITRWRTFCADVLAQIDHPEFIVKAEVENV